MERSQVYSGTITAEQFLFYEIRIASKYYLDGVPVEAAIEEIKGNNLFQYPTERLVSRMVRSCYKRLDALDNDALRWELSAAPIAIAKQINLYAIQSAGVGFYGWGDRGKVQESGFFLYTKGRECFLFPPPGAK